MDLRKQKCNINPSEKPTIWFSEPLFKLISGFNTVLGLLELIVNLI